KLVSIDVKQKELKDILLICFEGQNLTYSLKDNTVLIKKELKAANAANVQQRTITGIVTDENGNTMPGVSVELKGSNIGTVTDQQGQYSISINRDNVVLVFS